MLPPTKDGDRILDLEEWVERVYTAYSEKQNWEKKE